MNSKYSHWISVHPCFNSSAHFKFSRMHLPVAAKCNIQCNYCNPKKLNKCEFKPGYAEKLLTPLEAFKKVEDAIKVYPTLKVVGIAGPGDPLANKETFETFKLINESFPWLTKCLSTNGLLLPDKISKLVKLNIKTVTITINTINPNIGSKIYSWINYNNKIYTGIEGSLILIKNQLDGIELASKNDLKVKVNSVLIPGINDLELVNIAKEASIRGAFLMNIIPLIPSYKFKNFRPPTCKELNEARKECEAYLPQFRLCQQCRADGVYEPCGNLIKYIKT
ncbi:radical SAM protein [Candidatus Bathyarchaeota archaeon]|nr:radical SAM protein [Candidatus Bathyarchaeota archaeon]